MVRKRIGFVLRGWALAESALLAMPADLFSALSPKGEAGEMLYGRSSPPDIRTILV